MKVNLRSTSILIALLKVRQALLPLVIRDLKLTNEFVCS